MNGEDNPPAPGAVAVVGLACRFPGAGSAEEFWRNLRAGAESITFFDEEELRAAGVDPRQFREPNYVPAKGVLAQADCFDAAFFGFSPREAAMMDPQQRVFLECAWAALENAGYDPRGCEGSVGVFAGSILSMYLLQNLWPNRQLVNASGAFQTAVVNDTTFLASRVAYHLGLRGPSVSVGTACSTSLVAVHLACQSLLAYESDMALAGGVSVHLPLVCGYRYEDGSILSPDGHCRPFDAAAQGTVSGDGAGVVVLKRLEDALADGDFVNAVILGSAVNNDGGLKVGYTAPSVAGQARAITEALAVAGVSPDTISMVETHGAGTLLGDPIEFAALLEAFEGCEGRRRFCALGSVKSNVGHLDAAAGIAGFIKAVLALRHRELPPTLHFKEPNPRIDLDRSPFYVNNELRRFDDTDSPLRAGVSSFGIGGTNAHVILEEAPRRPTASDESEESDLEGQARPFDLLLLSARTPDALEAATDRLAEHLEQTPDLDLQDAAYTLRRGRRAFEHRRALVCGGREEAAAALRARDPQRLMTSAAPAGKPSVTFMFPGLGDHYAGMGWELYCAEREFRDVIDRCAELLRAHLETDVRDFLYPGRDWSRPTLSSATNTNGGGASNLDLRAMLAAARGGGSEEAAQPAIAQPAIFVTEVALAALLRAWGIEPDAMIGHSIGEFAAAHLSGVLSLPDALELVAARARLIQTHVAPGVMLAVPLGEEELRALLPSGLSLGAINGAALCIASGEEDEVRELEARLAGLNVSSQRLRSTHAYHSKMMEPLVEPLTDVLERFELRPPRVPYVSCITGTWITDEEATDPAYWAQHLCRTVRFHDGVSTLLRDSGRVLVEVGPGQGLTSHAVKEKSAQGLEGRVVPTMRWGYDKQSELAVLMRGVGHLWLAGVPLDATRFLARPVQRRVPLPTYPFERRRFWIDPPAEGQQQTGAADVQFKRMDVAEWFYLPCWKPSARPRLRQTGGEAGGWLVFADPYGVGAELAGRLRARGERVVTVAAGGGSRGNGNGNGDGGGNGNGFAVRDGGHDFAIDPRRARDYEELVRQLNDGGQSIDRVVHLWSLTSDEGNAPSGSRFNELQESGYYSVMRLLQALWRQGAGGALRVEIVANHLYEVDGGDELVPEKATLGGPALVAPQEHPGVVCRCLDTDIPPDDPARRDALVAQLMDEVCGEASDPAVAYRRGRRFVQAYEPVRLEAADGWRLPLRSRGVYLITGGLGGVGLVLARHLAETTQARLILVGRSAFPAREEWPRWLEERGPDDRTSRKIRQLQALEELGSEVLVLRADVSEREELRRALAAGEGRFGALDGVVHAAGHVGVETFREISQATTADSEAQFSAKVHGLLNLAELLDGRRLDFCLLTSSLSSVLGGLGFAAYSAANLFMDAFARRENRAGGTAWTSVNWDSWRLPDMRPAIAGLGASVSEFVMEPAEAAEACDRILAEGNLTQVVVSSGDLHARLRQWVGRDPQSESPAAAVTTHGRPNLSTPYEAPRGELERELAEIWQELFGVEQVGIHDNFFELGGHSLLATQLSARLYSKLQVEMSLATLLQSPTVAELAVAVVGVQAERADPAALESVLAEIGQLSESELRQLLAEQDLQ